MDQQGQNYWWYIGKKSFVRFLFNKTGVSPGGRVLDLGCGTGTLFEFLEGWGDVTGLELSADALLLARAKTNTQLVRASTDAIPLRQDTFSLIAAFDCLEHLKDDIGALRQSLRLLTPGGRLIVSVPCFQFLRSWRDEQLHHMRRYTRSELVRKLQHAGFHVDHIVYGYTCLFLPLLLKALKDRMSPKPDHFPSDIKKLREPWNSILAKWLTVEAYIASWTGLPVGTSLFAVARPVEPEDVTP